MTAMMQQYTTIKEKHKDCILLFRLGDFYEMFFEDALTASKDLGIALTGRNYGEEERAPMCGVPHHAVEGYIAQLIQKGHRVAICEQMEAPTPGSKTPVKREVVRVITPGTITDANMLDETKNNYIICVYNESKTKNSYTLAAADITTGAFVTTQFEIADQKSMIDEVAKFNPAEVLISETFPYPKAFDVEPTILPAWSFGSDFAYKTLTTHFNTLHLEGFGIDGNSPQIQAAGALLAYLQETHKGALSQITAIKPMQDDGFLILDKNTRQNLELTSPLRPWLKSNKESKKQTLLGVLDSTCTAMGARLLRSWVEMPLTSVSKIEERLNAVEEWAGHAFLRAELRDSLKEVHDLERLMGRLAGANANARDMASLKVSLTHLPWIKEKLWETKAPLNTRMHKSFDDLRDIHTLIDNTLVDEPPVNLRDGGLIKTGINAELDELISVKENGEAWLKDLEEKERANTGIKSLKIKFNRVFGYFIDITKANLGTSLPDNYIRKQTLANSERYTTPELDKLAETILNADERKNVLEYTIFQSLLKQVVYNIERIQFMASMIATLDALQSLGDVADKSHYCKPQINDGDTIHIKAGRHPVIEQTVSFVPNDTHLDGNKRRMAVITGPNMAGKSTYMRQVALITLMAQIGSFVPAQQAIIGVVDRLFTRVGASDDISGGQSTFMVEMTEVAHILHNATRKSLIIMDEIGRGTSTYDGLSIAWSVLEYIADEECIGAKTLFATHYHELTVMEERMKGVLNFSFALQEGDDKDDAVFLRKLIRGGADKSYGIQVAKLAGLPQVVVRRASKVLKALEGVNSVINTDDIEPHHAVFFSEEETEG